MEAALFAQGYGHAQTRLWQIYRTKLVVQGRLSEFFGPIALSLDKFSRTIGFSEIGKQAWSQLQNDQTKAEELQGLQAYCDGINAFLSGISLFGGTSVGMLPPEFLAMGIFNVEDWTPSDVMAHLAFLNFTLTWDWAQDYIRELLRLHGSTEMAETFVPFTIDKLETL